MTDDERKVADWFQANAEIPEETSKRIRLALYSDNPTTLGILARDRDWRVRRNVAANKQTTVETIITLLVDDYPEVQVAALCNAKTTYTMLLTLQEKVPPEVWERVKFWKLTPQTYQFIG